MSYLKKLGMYGIRSYGDPKTEKLEEISFFKPLTLILGNNGAGKSVRIIDCLLVPLLTTDIYRPSLSRCGLSQQARFRLTLSKARPSSKTLGSAEATLLRVKARYLSSLKQLTRSRFS